MKILGSDYDGTFNFGGVGEEKLCAVRKWRREGNKFGIITGRNTKDLKAILEKNPELEYDFIAAFNGGYITNREGEVLYEAKCDKLSVRALVGELFVPSCESVHINADRFVCVVRDKKIPPKGVEKESLLYLEEMEELGFFRQISLRFPTAEDAAPMVEYIKKSYDGLLNPLQNNRIIDVVPFGVDKAQGLYRVMEHYGASYGDVIAAGDNVNDVDMIREFRSYAMENSVDEVKTFADYVICDVTEIFKREAK